MRIREKALQQYLALSGMGIRRLIEVRALGKGVHGEGYLLRVETTRGGEARYVLKLVRPGGLGHDYPSDRAGMLLLARDTYNLLPKHVEAVEVLSRQADGSLRAIGGGREYYLLMRQAEGTSYFSDLEGFRGKAALSGSDKTKIRLMTRYLAGIHSARKRSRALYLRKLRDIIGHGECLMGVFDTYPPGTLSAGEMAGIEKKCIEWRARLRDKHKRLCQIHGDFHPGNIWFKSARDFVLLDRSRGPWGEAADDLTALSINYIFFSVKYHGGVKGAYLEALRLFFDSYVESTGDRDIYRMVAPFFAFRGAVVANPLFYPETGKPERMKLFGFMRGVLDAPEFDPARVNGYIPGS